MRRLAAFRARAAPENGRRDDFRNIFRDRASEPCERKGGAGVGPPAFVSFSFCLRRQGDKRTKKDKESQKTAKLRRKKASGSFTIKAGTEDGAGERSGFVPKRGDRPRRELAGHEEDAEGRRVRRGSRDGRLGL